MGWEKFSFTGESFFPKVTIRANAQIGFSQGAVKRFDLKKSRYCLLFYDREGDRIGINFEVDEQSDGAIPVRVRDFDFAIPAKAFLDYYGISYDKSLSYKAFKDSESGLIVIDLKSPIKRSARRTEI